MQTVNTSTRTIKVYIQELRAPFFTAVIIPVLLGTVIAYTEGYFNPLYFILTLVGMLFLHAGINVANDYFDFKSGTDIINKERTPFSGGSIFLVNGILSPKNVLFYSLILLSFGCAIGFYIVYILGEKGIFVLILGVIGVFGGFFYVAPPFRLSHHALGEIFVALNFGILVVFGTYYVQVQSFSLVPIVASIPVSLLITAVLYINQFPDYNADKQVGKWHLVVRLGREKAVYGHYALMIGTYVSIILGFAFSFMPLFSLIALLTIPFAVKSCLTLKKFHSETVKLIPAQGLTILTHLLTGILLILGFWIDLYF